MVHGGNLGKQKVRDYLEITLFAAMAGKGVREILLTAYAALRGHKCQTFLK